LWDYCSVGIDQCKSISDIGEMTDDRSSGMALIIGSIASIITMALHPTGHDLSAPGRFHAMAQLSVAVHSLALMSLPIQFLGAWGLSRRLASAGWLGAAGLCTYGFATVAVMNAAVASGMVGTHIAVRIAEASQADPAWEALYRYTGEWNQAFALIFVVGSSIAILLWSAAIVKSRALPRGLGTYGCVLGPITLVAVLSGHIRLNVHGFGAIILAQALWWIIAGVQLWKTGNAPAPVTT
jgi:hypothetical protein